MRYRLLESTRAYAAERPAAQAEENGAQRRYTVRVPHLFERAEQEWFWRVKRDWMGGYAATSGDG